MQIDNPESSDQKNHHGFFKHEHDRTSIRKGYQLTGAGESSLAPQLPYTK